MDASDQTANTAATDSMSPMSRGTLKVPGASLYFEIRGSGTALLMIPGGPADAGAFAGLAEILAERYTVVTYDPRGNSRSTFDGPPRDWRADVHADDARRLLAAVGPEPADVLASSSGALVGLELVARFPEQVHTLVAHEPPITELLPDAERHRAIGREVYDIYRTAGVGPAMARFLAVAGLDGGLPQEATGPRGEPEPEIVEMMARMERNLDLFFAHGWLQIGGYVPDFAALRAASTRIVVAGGEASRGQLAYAAGAAVAERLGTTVVHFPGDHGGFASDPVAFAERLHEVLRGDAAPRGSRLGAA
jgi:pimeloyl-ACP methyl ester carboxylesterase